MRIEKKIMRSILAILILSTCIACNNSADEVTTADSLNRAPSIDTIQTGDTASYQRMPDKVADSTNKP